MPLMSARVAILMTFPEECTLGLAKHAGFIRNRDKGTLYTFVAAYLLKKQSLRLSMKCRHRKTIRLPVDPCTKNFIFFVVIHMKIIFVNWRQLFYTEKWIEKYNRAGMST